MRLERLQRVLIWPASVQPPQLRSWLLQQLAGEGELLRWAITAVSREPDGQRHLQVEAVISR